ncbi:MAG: hypothetical protein ACT4QC_02910 [Planctomycetaceae bacterium]
MKMPLWSVACAASAALWLQSASSRAGELPAKVKSSPCTQAPKIDGKAAEDEWKAAPAIEFDLTMLKLATQTPSSRKCQLRVMNSANGLYVALRVPDQKENRTFDPLELDLAGIVFCRGKELQVGDDRKFVAPGLYFDKHLVNPGQPTDSDADDAQPDGNAVMTYDSQAKAWTIEWAVPLGATDKEDIQVKPGDSFRFNIAFFDSFQPGDLSLTEIGTAYRDLDHADAWGQLELAADVKDDGGAAFKP